MGRPVMQFQILSKDPAASEAFYTTLFDWSVNADNPLGYRVIDTGAGRGIGGGIFPAPPEGQALVSLYVEVDDVAATLEKATGLGAQVVMPPMKLPQGEEMAVLSDPEGIPVGVFKPA